MLDKKIKDTPDNDIKDNKVTIKLNMNMLIVGALSILVFVSVIQTVALANLINKKPSASSDSYTQTANNQAAGTGKSTLPAALQNVPQQVGGC